MSTATVDTTGLDRLRARLAKVANPDPTDLLLRVADVMDEDNRRGILKGEDGNGNPMVRVTYRPIGKKGVKLTVAQRLGQKGGIKRGKYSRIGSGIERNNNNLTSAEYRLLDGPPLAPRRQYSRVITNYHQNARQIGQRTWEVVGAWINVLSRKGVPFLRYHFEGAGHLPIRDLRGIRPWGMERIRSATRAWMIDQVRSAP
jgi:hypothetical protein